MIADAASYVASRVAGNAVENIARRAAWAGLVGVLLLAALSFGLIATYAYLQPIYGSVQSAALIAGGCLAAVVLLLAVPWFTSRIQRALPDEKPSPSGEPLAAVDEEARDAIDYFGAAKVMATAFMFGFGAARRIKR